MGRRRIAIAVLAAGLAVGLAGCGARAVSGTASVAGAGSSAGTVAGTGSAAATSPSAPPGVNAAAVAWADKFCGTVLSLTDIAKVPFTPDMTTPQTAKASLTDFLTKASALFGTAVDGLHNLGAAPTPTGAELATKMAAALGDVKKSFDDGLASLQQADPNDPSGFQRAFQAAGESLGKIGSMKNPTEGITGDPTLEQAAAAAPNCQKVRGLDTSAAPTS
ncbi:hypothetical protein F0L68_13445 [Solihabitans fulvus]|uniref:Uncharacterized protein n=1 Tax=Solihabitans fulvus TaxID=1892852 RepID=A0A5B2XHB8_9PSEU|nr:hypothetical protein [Solihabitans fulvus]KAA2262281.1 hypothetical protein F0L68_13445 [Solihabitans fulvus]